MQYKLLIQYPNKNPLDFVDNGIVNLENAIIAFNNFDWKKQFKIISKRDGQKLTSSRPSVIFDNTEKVEALFIECTNEGDFLIKYQFENKSGIDFVSEDITKNPSGNAVQDYIIALFQNELEAKFEFENTTPVAETIEFGKYNPKKYLAHLWVFLMPFAILIIHPKTNFDNGDFFYLMGMFSAIIAISYFPFFAILIQYLSKPKLLSALIIPDTSSLQIRYADKQVLIEKSDILQCTHTFCTNHNLPWSSVGNIVITLKDKSQHFLTTLTFSEENLRLLIQLLQINYYHFDTAFPFIKTTIQSDIVEVSHSYKSKKEDLEILYSNYSDEMLKEVLNNELDYQPDAVEVAKKELKKRITE